MRLGARPKYYDVRRPVLLGYAALALAFSAALLGQSARRGHGELGGWLATYVAVGLLAWVRPQAAPAVSGFAAFALGFVRTYRHGPNLDLGLGLVLLSVGLYLFDRLRHDRSRRPLDVPGLCLLAVSCWSVVSLAFAVARIRSFVPAPGFSYHVFGSTLSGCPRKRPSCER